MLFWNVAEIGRQDKEFWEYIKGFDFVTLGETWIEEKNWNKLKDLLRSLHVWNCYFAKRINRRGRAKGGFIIGEKKGWGDSNRKLIEKSVEGWIVTRIEKVFKRKYLLVISIYN